MKKASELGLRVFEVDGCIFVTKENFITLSHSDPSKAKYASELSDLIAISKPIPGVPLLMIEDEVGKLAQQEVPVNVVKISNTLELDAAVMTRRGFIQGYNLSQKTHPHSTHSVVNILLDAIVFGQSLVEPHDEASATKQQRKIEKFIDDKAKTLSEKELWIEVEYYDPVPPTRQVGIRPKIFSNQLKAAWK